MRATGSAGRGRTWATVRGRTWASVRGRTWASTAVLAVLGSLLATVPQPAAAATPCTATRAQIYEAAPVPPGARPGTVLRCRRTADSTDSWRDVASYLVQYVTTDRRGRLVATTGAVLVPWTAFGPDGVVAGTSVTNGLGFRCAASRQVTGEFVDDLGAPILTGNLDDGHVLALADGLGYLRGQTPHFGSGAENGRAQLDVVRAALQLPAGLPRRPPVVLAGYSGGGQSALWAAQLARSYAPDLTVVGAAVGGVPVDLRATAKALDGSIWAGIRDAAFIGLAAAHPGMPLRSLLTPAGARDVFSVRDQCLTGTTATRAFSEISDATVGGRSLDGLLAVRGPDGTWGQVLDEQRLAVGTGRPGSGARHEIGFPLLDYWGSLDELSPPAVQAAAARRLCASGVVVRTSVYPGVVHPAAGFAALPEARTWVAARFAGLPERGTC